MSKEKTETMDVVILDQEFRVACPEDERAELLETVAYLDKKMREVRDTGKVVTLERIAVMAALNITHELLTTRLATGFDMGEFKRSDEVRNVIVAAWSKREDRYSELRAALKPGADKVEMYYIGG